MSIGPHFLKPALAPLNFANVSLMGRLITSGLRELAAQNLLKQLDAGIEAAAQGAGVRAADVSKVVPLERFVELARKLDAHQRLAVDAWDDHPVESKRTGDLANLTEKKSLPVLSDSLMRLATMANANPELRMALYEMSHLMRDWQALVLETGTKLDDDRILSDALRRRALRRAVGGLAVLAAVGVGLYVWQQNEAARRRVGAQIGAEDPCAVFTIEASDLARAMPDQQKSIEGRKRECETRREVKAREEAERAKKEADARECASVADAVKAGKAPPPASSVPPKLFAFAERIASGKLEHDDLGPSEPKFPCADTDGLVAMKAAFRRAVVQSQHWASHEDLSPSAKAAIDANKDAIPKDTKLAIAERAERLAVEALQDRRPAKVAEARRLCGYKRLFGLGHKAFCHAISSN
ncbi:MAG: hypothetical protein FJ095_10225 [Deltaproteobacteria bacterium]|nr:hypothetical protein [Deltaproteobacteria bacterium]